MKITAKQYALALAGSLVGQEMAAAKKLLDNFVRLLAQNRDLGLAENIIFELGKIWDAGEGKLEAEITSTHQPNEETLELVQAYLKRMTAAKKISLIKKMDKGLLGGVVIKYGDKVIDLSLKRRLADLREQLVA